VLRGVSAMTAMTALSRILGLLREQVRGYFLGTGMASDAFGVAGLLPNLLRRMFAEGAMTAAFVPVFAEYRNNDDPEARNLFLSRFLTLFTFAMTGLTVLGIATSRWLVPALFPGFADVPEKMALTIVLTEIMWPYLAFVSVAAIVQAILNSYRVFAPSAFTPVLLNLVTIGVVLAFHERFEDPAYAFAWGFTLGGIAQLAFQIPFLRGRGLRIRFRFESGPGVRHVFAIFLPGAFSAGIHQINVLVSQFIATLLPEGAVSALQFSLRLQELVLGLFAVSISTVILPVMSDLVVRGDTDGLKDTLGFGASLAAFVTIPASLGLILLGEPIVRLLFEWGEFDSESTRLVTYAVTFHAVGIFAIALSRIVTSVFYAMRDMVTPTRVAFFVMVLHAGLAFGLSIPLAHGGIALAGGLAAAANVVALWWILRRRIGPLGTRAQLASLARIGAASLAMCLAIFGALAAVDPMAIVSRALLAAVVLGVIALGIAVYLAAARLLKAPELDEVLRLVARRRRRRGGNG
jgi:putative peptidoglycan lipid II flippase